MKRIIFVEARFNSVYGAQISMMELMECLDRQKWQAQLLTTQEGELTKEADRRGIPYKVIPLSPIANVFGRKIGSYSFWNKLRVFGALIILNFRLWRYIKSKCFDVIYVNDERALIYSLFSRYFSRVPLVWYVRGPGVGGWLTSLSVSVADHILLIASRLKESFPKYLHEKLLLKSTVLHTGFNFQLYAPVQLPSRSFFKIGYVGSIVNNKGIHLIIKLVERLKKRGFKVKVDLIGGMAAGHEDYYNEMKQGVEERQLSECINFLGFHSDPLPFYESFDLTLLPSMGEGLPRVLVESLAKGTPVVASDVGGCREIIRDSYLGVTFPSGDMDKLEKAVVDMFNDKILNTLEKKKKRQKFIKDNFSMNAYCQRFDQLLTTLLSKNC